MINNHIIISFIIIVLIFIYLTGFFHNNTSSEKKKNSINKEVKIETNISFFNKSIPLLKWKTHINQLKLLFTHGTWINAWNHPQYQPYYSKPCTYENPFIYRFFEGKCFDSLGFMGYQYLWQPNRINKPKSKLSKHLNKTNHLHLWSAESMCNILYGRNILFIGDSIQNEFYFEFISAMLHRIISNSTDKDELNKLKDKNNFKCSNLCIYDINNHKCETSMKPLNIDCGNNIPSFSVYFFKIYKLACDIMNESLQDIESPDLKEFKLSLIKDLNISVIIINTGLHYQNDENLILNVNNTLSLIYKLYPSLSVIWRSTSPAHAFSNENILNNPTLKYNNYFYENSENYTAWNMYKKDWLWDKFKIQNDLVEKLIFDNYPQILYFDIYPSTNQRSDSHVSDSRFVKSDGVHYCLLGPLSQWLTFLYNSLQVLLDKDNKLNRNQTVVIQKHDNNLLTYGNYKEFQSNELDNRIVKCSNCPDEPNLMYYFTNSLRNNKIDFEKVIDINNLTLAIPGSSELRKDNAYYKHRIPDYETFKILGEFDKREIFYIKYVEFMLFTSGEPIPSLKSFYEIFTLSPTSAPTLIISNGTMLREVHSKEVFYYNNSLLHLVPSVTIFVGMGYEWSDVMVVPDLSLSKMSHGSDCPMC